MKLILAAVLVASGIFILLPQNVFATTVEVAQITDQEREMAQAVAVDFIYSRTFRRDLKSDNGTDYVKSMTQAHVKIAYTKIEQAQPYLKLGFTQFKEKFNDTTITNLAGQRNILFSYDPAFSYGLGLDGILTRAYGLSLEYDLQYLRSKNRLFKVKQNNKGSSSISGKMLLEEWHIAFLVSKELDFGRKNFNYEDTDIDFNLSLRPYLGLRYSDLRLKITKDLSYYAVSDSATIVCTGKSEAEDNYGIFGGLAMNISDKWGLRFEGRFLDELASSFSANYRF